jgi:acyl-CoA reductase-like NAD-dependent aldehyde dehydrogenase
VLHTEEAGINPVVLHSTADFAGLTRNLAFSLALYSGQMCTAPQNIFIPRDGLMTDEGHKGFDEVAAALAAAVDALLADPARAAGVLGAIQNPATLDRVAARARWGAWCATAALWRCRASRRRGPRRRCSSPSTAIPAPPGARSASARSPS